MARDFTASNNDFIDFGNPSNVNITGDEITLSIWSRCVTGSKIFAKWSAAGQSYLIEITGGGVARFALQPVGDGNPESTTALNDGVWHHVAATYDGSDKRIYADGVDEGSTAATGNISSTTQPLYLGARSNGGDHFDGDLGHAAIWGRALSPGEVKALSEGISPLALDRTGLVFYAPLNGQSPEPDVIGGASGTVTGATVAEEPPIPNSIVAP